MSFKSIITSLIFSFLGIFVSLLAVEGTLRLLPVLFSSGGESHWSDRPEAYYKPTSSSTLQDYNYPEKAADKWRIAVVGDSFTFAPYMQFDDAFPKKLERMLNLHTQNVEVINYGVPGASTSHEVGTARKAVEQGADLIILQITLNDPQIKPYTPTGLTRGNEFGPYTPSTSGLGKYFKILEFIKERIHNTQTHQKYVDYYFGLFNKKRTFEHFEHSISKFGKLRRNKRVPVIAVLFPLFGLPLDTHYPFHPLHKKVKEVAKKHNIPLLDLFTSYEGIPLSRLQVIPAVDFHPNEIGHRIAAEHIYSWLVNEKMIPNKYQISQFFSERIDIRPLDKWKVSPRIDD